MGRAGMLVGLLLWPMAAWAGGAEAPPPDLGGLCRLIGKPSRPDRVLAAWDRVREEEPEQAIRLAAALGLCGGVGAMDVLPDLMRDRDAMVRIAAIRAAGRVGLRDKRIVARLRETLRWRTNQERRAAMLALSRIGDGRDVESLLHLGLDADDATALTAFRALATLTGVRLPPVYARWSYWWRSTRTRLHDDFVDALDAIEEDPGGLASDQHQRVVQRNAWVDLRGLEARLDLWLRASDADLRRRAVLLIGELGLLELTPRIARLQLFSLGDEALDSAADEVLRKLGMRLSPDPVVELPADGASEPVGETDHPVADLPESSSDAGEAAPASEGDTPKTAPARAR